jgi:hypothetical protein
MVESFLPVHGFCCQGSDNATAIDLYGYGLIYARHLKPRRREGREKEIATDADRWTRINQNKFSLISSV